jgi:periplasmic copper chaperone A
MRWLFLAFAFSSASALAQVEIENPWSRATPGGAKVAAGYMVLNNRAGSAERLVSATSPAAERVETHVHIKEGDVMRMREVKGYDIPPKGRFELKPGGAHLMFMNIKAPFKDGERIPVTLKFERAGEVKTELLVGKPGAAAAPHKHH